MNRIQKILLIFCIVVFVSDTLSGQGLSSRITEDGLYIPYGRITENTLEPLNDKAFKASQEKEFTIEVIYEGTACERDFSSFEIRNAYFPITWYELDNFGERINPIMNANPSQLKDHTTYIIEDFYFHTDTVYVDFKKSIMFENIYPNPSSTDINLVFSITDEIHLALSIFDTNGKQYYFHEGKVSSENNTINISMHKFRKGIYLLSLRSECFNETLKLIHLGF